MALDLIRPRGLGQMIEHQGQSFVRPEEDEYFLIATSILCSRRAAKPKAKAKAVEWSHTPSCTGDVGYRLIKTPRKNPCMVVGQLKCNKCGDDIDSLKFLSWAQEHLPELHGHLPPASMHHKIRNGLEYYYGQNPSWRPQAPVPDAANLQLPATASSPTASSASKHALVAHTPLRAGEAFTMGAAGSSTHNDQLTTASFVDSAASVDVVREVPPAAPAQPHTTLSTNAIKRKRTPDAMATSADNASQRPPAAVSAQASSTTSICSTGEHTGAREGRTQADATAPAVQPVGDGSGSPDGDAEPARQTTINNVVTTTSYKAAASGKQSAKSHTATPTVASTPPASSLLRVCDEASHTSDEVTPTRSRLNEAVHNASINDNEPQWLFDTLDKEDARRLYDYIANIKAEAAREQARLHDINNDLKAENDELLTCMVNYDASDQSNAQNKATSVRQRFNESLEDLRTSNAEQGSVIIRKDHTIAEMRVEKEGLQNRITQLEEDVEYQASTIRDQEIKLDDYRKGKTDSEKHHLHIVSQLDGQHEEMQKEDIISRREKDVSSRRLQRIHHLEAELKEAKIKINKLESQNLKLLTKDKNSSTTKKRTEWFYQFNLAAAKCSSSPTTHLKAVIEAARRNHDTDVHLLALAELARSLAQGGDWKGCSTCIKELEKMMSYVPFENDAAAPQSNPDAMDEDATAPSFRKEHGSERYVLFIYLVVRSILSGRSTEAALANACLKEAKLLADDDSQQCVFEMVINGCTNTPTSKTPKHKQLHE